MKLGRKPEKWLQKKSKGFHGFPIATLAFYGPDDRRATKVVDCPHCPFWAGRGRFAAVPGHLRGHVG